MGARATPPRPAPPDQAIRDAIVAGIDSSCFVEASAGTGKTSLLVARILALLRRPEMRVERLVAITFTEKAAAELRGRVRDALQREVADPAAEGRAALVRALEDLDRAAITTIHSFCTRLLREFPVEAGVSPGYRVIDEIEAGRLFDATWDEWLAAALSQSDSPLRGPLECGARLEGAGPNGGPGLKEMARILTSNRDLPIGGEAAEDPAPGERRRLLLRDYRGALRAALDDMEARLGACRQPGSDEALARLKPALSTARRALAASADEGAGGLRRLLTMPAWPRIGRSGQKGNWPGELLKELRAVSQAQVEREERFRADIRAQAVREAALALTGFLAAYAAAKDRQGVLDFDDLLLRARDLVRGSAAVRTELQTSISHLLVDEYQDTDPLQAEIIFLLASEDPRESEWRKTRPAPGRLFLVGDPKQSIYRFRRADIAIYNQSVETLLDAGGRRHAIEANFRTLEPIIDWVNKVFESLMRPAGPADAAFRPAYSRLEPCRPADPAPLPGLPRVARLPLEPAGTDAGSRREDEARRTAALVRYFVEAGGARTQSRQAGGGWRAPAWGDVALLFRKLTSIGIYEDAFREAGVPYRVEGGRLYFARAEVQGLAALLRAVDNPNDRLALVAALRSPFFGFDDDTLLVTADAGRLGWAAPTPPDDAALAEAFTWLAEWHRQRHELGPALLIERILERTRALEFFSLKPDGAQRVANLLKVADEARRFSADAGAYRAFVRHLAEREAASAAEGEGESPIQEEAGNAFVRFLSVHKSKGLEFPIVILADAAGKAGGVTPSYLVDRAGGRLAVSLSFVGGIGRSPAWDELKLMEDAQARSEAIRLFYVAATRARDLLVIPSGGKPGAGSFLEMIPAGLEPDDLEIGGLRFPEGEARPLRLDLTLRPAGASAAPDPLGEAGAEFASRRAALLGGLPRPARRLTPAALAISEEPGGEWPGEALRGEADGRAEPGGALALGSLVHAVLERVDLAGESVETWLDRLAAAEPGAPAVDHAEALRLVRNALAHPVWGRVRAARDVRREAPFLSRHALDSGETVYLDGKVDLAFAGPEGWVLVDYKTNRATAADVDTLAALYRGQGLAYALGVSASLGAPVREVIFLFLDPGIERALTIDEAALAEATRRLAGALARPSR